jgi:ABC-2 type transport system ATP-binding protein
MLELDGVTRRFGTVTALDAVSFGVERGEVLGFVGSNGAGKTTAMRIIMGIIDADEGEVRFAGAPIDATQRRRFGYLPEERGLYPKVPVVRQLTYLGRLHGMPRREARAAAVSWLDRLGMAARTSERIERLSMGNQQRVQLAAALMHDPQLLVLDEPFSGLDPLGVDALAGAVLERAKDGVPVLLSSHQLDLVERLCDSIAIVHAGRVVAHGTVEGLRTRSPRRVLEVAVEGGSLDWADAEATAGPSGTATDGLAAERRPGTDVRPAAPPGVRPIGRTGVMTVLELDPGADEQAVLDAARAAGRVTHFAFRRPTLAELYREVLTP